MSTFNDENNKNLRRSERGVGALCAILVCLTWASRTLATEQNAATPPKLTVSMSGEVKTVESQAPAIDIIISAPEKPTISGCPVLSEFSEPTSTSLLFSVETDPSGQRNTWRARSEAKAVPGLSGGTASNRPVLAHGTYKCTITLSAGQESLSRDVRISVRADRGLPIFLLVLGELVAIGVIAYRSSVPRAEVEKRLMHLSKDLHKTRHIDSRFRNAIQKRIELAEAKIELEKLNLASQLIHEGEGILEKWQHESDKWARAFSNLEALCENSEAKQKKHPLIGTLNLRIEARLDDAYQASSAADFDKRNEDLVTLNEKCKALCAKYDNMLNIAKERHKEPAYSNFTDEFSGIKKRYSEPTRESLDKQIDDRSKEIDDFITKLKLIPVKITMHGETTALNSSGEPPIDVTPTRPRNHSFRTIMFDYVAPVLRLIFSHAVILGMSYYKLYYQNLTFGSFEDYLYLSLCPLLVEQFGFDASKLPNNLRDTLRSLSNVPGTTPQPTQPSPPSPNPS